MAAFHGGAHGCGVIWCLSSETSVMHAFVTCLLDRTGLLHFDLYLLIIIASLHQSQVHAELSALALTA